MIRQVPGTDRATSSQQFLHRMMFFDARQQEVQAAEAEGQTTMIDAQAMHLLRQGGTTRDVRLVRSASSAMRFPQLPK